jgi:hypothetical protein
MYPLWWEIMEISTNNLGYVCNSNFWILVHQSQIKWQHVVVGFF